jgi:hypothetical protein
MADGPFVFVAVVAVPAAGANLLSGQYKTGLGR